MANEKKELGLEEERKKSLEELMKAGDDDMDLQFEESVLGGIRGDRIPADTPREQIERTIEELKRKTRERVLQLKKQCLDLGITQEEIKAAAVEWRAKKKVQ